MFLPESARLCIRALEEAGFRAYAVGGCVRDALLGNPAHDYDLCTSAEPEQTAQVFSGYSLVRNGEKHGTIGVVIGGEVIEITTFRTEGGYQDSRHPDWVKFVGTVAEDLARRDFTVNAMAFNPSEGYIDPWGGQEDLQTKVLRAVGDPEVRFREDALRILRGVRFAVRFGLTPEKKTMDAMVSLSPLMENLARERVFEELCKLLPLVTAQDLFRYRDILVQVIPELGACVDFHQHSPHHAYDVFTHIAHTVEATPAELSLRWAALLHDTGTPGCYILGADGRGHFPGHAQLSAQIADDVLRRLKAPTALREQVVFLVSHHMTPIEPDKRLLRRRLGRYGIETLQQLLVLQEADMGSKGTGATSCERFPILRKLIDEVLDEDACLGIRDLAVNGQDLMALGFAAGPALGKCLNHLLEQVQDEALPNEKAALLQAAKDYLTEESV